MDPDNYKKKVMAQMASYCAYQDRCFSEVSEKLSGFMLSEDEKDDIIQELTEEDFLNEQRFAASFARGKFNFKKWGKSKIIFALKQKKVPENLIKDALEEIPDGAYRETLIILLRKKAEGLEAENLQKEKAKLYQYAIAKGYEQSFVLECMEEVLAQLK